VRSASAESVGTAHPRQTAALFGHDEAEQALLDSYRTARMPHAWLLAGAKGIGKATLAYRMARFVLAHPDPASPQVRASRSLAVNRDHPVARQVAAQAHPDLLMLERTAGATGALRSVITVDEVRRTVSFFGSTAGAGGWRVCIVDSADELQLPQGANALLKVLEEPPANALFLVVGHAPGRLLATIRSRCRRLTLRPLGPGDVARAAACALGRDEYDDVRRAADVARGSVARALMLLGGPALALRERVTQLLRALPEVDPRSLHGVGDTLARSDDNVFETFIETIREWLTAQLAIKPAEPRRLAPVAEAWEKLDRIARDVEVFNLDRKPMVFAIFGVLGEMTRRRSSRAPELSL
jgi:DNA polymerase III subunit delta'